MVRTYCVRWAAVIAVLGILLIPCTAARADLLGYWDMNAGAGTTVADQSGNGINGSLVGSAGWTTAGKFDGGTTYTGSGSDYIATGENISAIGTDDFTVSLWFKGSETCEPGLTTGGWRFLFSIGSQSNADAMFITTNGGGLRVALGGWFHDVSGGGGSFTDTDWYNVALVRSGTDILTYVNGDLKSTMQYQTTNPLDNGYYNNASVGGNKVYIGSFPGAGWSLNGAMDDIAIWNEALSAPQIAAIAQGTLSPASFAVPEPSVVVLLTSGLLGLLAYAWRKRK